MQWLLEHTLGLIIDLSIVEEILDPYKIHSLDDLDKHLNKLSQESGFGVEVSAYSVNPLNPNSATIIVSSGTELMRKFIATLISSFLAYHKSLGIDYVHNRSSSIRLDYKQCDLKTAENSLKEYFGKFELLESARRGDEQFWTNLSRLYARMRANLITLNKYQFEKFLHNEPMSTCPCLESLCNRHLNDLTISELVEAISKTHVTMNIIDSIDYHLEDGQEIITMYLSYNNEKTPETLERYYSQLFKSADLNFNSKSTMTSLIFNRPIEKTDQ